MLCGRRWALDVAGGMRPPDRRRTAGAAEEQTLAEAQDRACSASVLLVLACMR